MSRLLNLLNSFVKQPSYTLMRGVGRFDLVRTLVANAKGVVQVSRTRKLLETCERDVSGSCFADLDRVDFVRLLREDGVAFGLSLPPALVGEIRSWAEQQTCFADREPALGFQLGNRPAAETKLGKPILIAQYFNTATECPAIGQLVNDSVLAGSLPDTSGRCRRLSEPISGGPFQ